MRVAVHWRPNRVRHVQSKNAEQSRGTTLECGSKPPVCSPFSVWMFPVSITDICCRSATCPEDKARVRLADGGGPYLEVCAEPIAVLVLDLLLRWQGEAPCAWALQRGGFVQGHRVLEGGARSSGRRPKTAAHPECVNDFAPSFVMDLLRKVVLISGCSSPIAVD